MRDGWWNCAGCPLPDEWSAWWAFATFVVAAVAAVVALRQFTSYIHDKEEAARPFVIVDYAFHSVLMRVEVKNTGPSVATDIKLRTNVPFQSNLRDQAEVMNRVFGDGYTIKQLVPGRAIQWTLDRTPDYATSKFPGNYEVTVTYTDPRLLRHSQWWKFWEPKRARTFTDTFDLNLDQWTEANADSDYDNQNWNINSRNERRMEKASTALHSIANSLDDLVQEPARTMPIRRRRRLSRP